MSVVELATRCNSESQSRRPVPQNLSSCFELFRRAIVDRNEAAWEAVHAQYSNLVRSWIGARDNTEDSAQETFARFFRAMNPEKLKNFPTIGALLKYLKTTATNACIDALRKEERERQALAERMADFENRLESADIEHRMDAEALRAYIRGQLKDDDERLVFVSLFEFDLPPREIAERHSQHFSSAQQVSRIRDRIVKRLQRDPYLSRIVDDE